MAPSEPITEPSEPTSEPVAEPTSAFPKQSQTFSNKKVSVVLDERALDANSTPLTDSRVPSCRRQTISLVPGAKRLWHMRPTDNQDTRAIDDSGPFATSGGGEEDTHPITDILPTNPFTIEAECCTRVALCAPVDSTVLPGVNGVSETDAMANLPCVDLPRVEAVNGVHGQGE
ncbi:hypothetical protein V6N11_010780 [Hibiscus sabdariffa]|uniref:Uncharacterized protein n=1 Tax=Hibiscus sabdariffa TaxID=183260 RepID=A0ABR2S763_9ROSI